MQLVELHIDRAYLSSQWVKAREANLQIFCKAWPVRNGERFDKTAFILDWNQGLIRCPNQVTISFEQGKVVQFPNRLVRFVHYAHGALPVLRVALFLSTPIKP